MYNSFLDAESPSIPKTELPFEVYKNLLSGYIAFYESDLEQEIAIHKIVSAYDQSKNLILKELTSTIISKITDS